MQKPVFSLRGSFKPVSIVGTCNIFVCVDAQRPSQQFFSHVGTEPPLLKTEKLLGVHIDNSLSWSFHIESTLKKSNSLLFLLNRTKQYLNVPTRKLFYNAYILPHIDYCCSIWGNVNSELMNTVIKFQKRA